MSDNINLSPREKNLLTGILYDEKHERSRKHMDTQPIDCLSDGCGVSADISIGGVFESEHGRFTVQDIDGKKIKVNGNWYMKSEFEPATVTRFKGHMGMER